MKLWILKSEVNDYNQHGEYFEAAFSKMPTAEQIKKAINVDSDELVKHILAGGGRQGFEDGWYILDVYETED